MPATTPRIACALMLIMTLALSGCQPKTTWVDTGTTYTAEQARALLESVDTSRISQKKAADAARLRVDALASLRGDGEAASQAALLIARTLPADSPGVPAYVELARLGDRKAIVVVEAWGLDGENLDRKRLWVLDSTTGDVIESAAR